MAEDAPSTVVSEAPGGGGPHISLAAASDANTLDLTDYGYSVMVQGATFSNIDPEGSTGTGVIQPFVQLNPQGNQDYEEGVNTTTNQPPFDEQNVDNYNHDLPLNLVPQVACDAGVCREIIVDLNESDSGNEALISLDAWIVFVHNKPGFGKNDIDQATFRVDPCADSWFTGAYCQVEYDLDGNLIGPDPATDVAIMLNYTLNPGSGDGDNRFLIPDFGPGGCDYNGGVGGDCGYYLAVYSYYGGTPGERTFDYGLGPGGGEVSDGFEENTVRILPVLDVEKTVTTSAQQAFTWSVLKSAEPDWDLFDGETGTSNYEIVVDKIPGAYANWAASGEIIITNVGDQDAPLLDIQDAGVGSNFMLTCPDEFPIAVDTDAPVLGPDDTYTCTWSADLLATTDYTNDVDVIVDDPDFDGIQENQVFSGSVDFDTNGDPDEIAEGEINGTATLDDDNPDGPQGEVVTDDQTFNYSSTFTCPDDEGTQVNTATLTDAMGNEYEDKGYVKVHCYEITVEKTADESFTRYYEWTIDKTGDQTALTLQPSQSPFLVNYDVMVDLAGAATDNDWRVMGEITISNPHPTEAADLTQVLDEIDVFGSVTPDCSGATSVPSGGSIVCTYDTGEQDSEDSNPFGDLNTATATRQNYDWTYEGNPLAKVKTASGTTDVFGTSAVDFSGVTPDEVDECIDVEDTYAGFLGTVCADAPPPVTFEYSRLIDPSTLPECAETPIDNTASFETNDTGATGSDDWTVVVTIDCPSCTLTQGYWKTHNVSFWGGAPDDPTWALVGGPNATFFDSDDGNVNQNLPAGTPDGSYIDAMWTPPAGNMYFQLARQYIAAELNELAFASLGSYQATFDEATTFLSTYSQEQVAADSDLNAQAQALASILAEFNESGDESPTCSLDPVSTGQIVFY